MSVEFAKHCYAVVDSTRRKLEYSTYGGKSQALEACKAYESKVKKLMIRYDTLARKPDERKAWIKDIFGGEAILLGKSLAAQKANLMQRLKCGEIPEVEALMMEAAIRSAPSVEKKDALSLSYDQESSKYKAILRSDKGEDVTKMCDDIREARNWLLNMGASSEARQIYSVVLVVVCVIIMHMYMTVIYKYLVCCYIIQIEY